MTSIKKEVGHIVGLFYSTSTGRESVSALHLDRKGVLEDKFYNKNRERSVLLASLESYTLAKSHGIDAPHSTLGENLLMDYNPYALHQGDTLHIGEVVLEISQHCTLCKSLSKIDSQLPKILKEHRGIFAKVIQAGVLKKGDTIYLVNSVK